MALILVMEQDPNYQIILVTTLAPQENLVLTDASNEES